MIISELARLYSQCTALKKKGDAVRSNRFFQPRETCLPRLVGTQRPRLREYSDRGWREYSDRGWREHSGRSWRGI